MCCEGWDWVGDCEGTAIDCALALTMAMDRCRRYCPWLLVSFGLLVWLMHRVACVRGLASGPDPTPTLKLRTYSLLLSLRHWRHTPARSKLRREGCMTREQRH